MNFNAHNLPRGTVFPNGIEESLIFEQEEEEFEPVTLVPHPTKSWKNKNLEG